MNQLKYSNGTPIRSIQKIQVSILKEFDKLCKDNDIEYFLFAGSLLGAVRHNGFIPWDDDIDIAMVRAEYEKFLNIAGKEFGNDIFVQNIDTDTDYNLHFTKLRKNYTLFVDEFSQESKGHQGIFVDIFPLDNINLPPSKTKNFLIRIVQIINLSRFKYFRKRSNNIFKIVIFNIANFIRIIIPRKFLHRVYSNLLLSLGDSDSEYVTHLGNIYSKERCESYAIRKNEISTIEAEFEGFHFPILKNYDDVLTKLYGDYTMLPPHNKRYPHHRIITINLNTKEKIK